MTNEKNMERSEIWDKKRLLVWFAAQGRVWTTSRRAIIKFSKWLNQNKTITAVVLFFYFSVIGLVYDVIYYQWGFGLDPIKYINMEDFVFSAAKHWDVALVGIPLMFVAYVILMSALKLVLLVARLILKAIPEKMKTPDYPELPKFRKARPSSPQVKTGRVTGQEERGTLAGLYARAIANFFLNAVAFIKYIGRTLVVALIKLVAMGCNGLIWLYALVALFMVGGLSTSAKVLRTSVVVIVIFLVPIIIAPLIAFSFFHHDSDKVGEVCTRRPFECKKAKHVGATRDYGFFAIPSEQRDNSSGAVLGPDRSSIIVRVFDFLQGSLKETLNINTERPVRDDGSIRAIPLSNIATFSLSGSGATVSPRPEFATRDDILRLEDVMNSNREEILKKIGEAGGRGANNKAVLKRIDALGEARARDIAAVAQRVDEVGRAFHNANRETLDRLRAIEKSTGSLAAGHAKMETVLGKKIADVDLKLTQYAFALAALEKAVEAGAQANLQGMSTLKKTVEISAQENLRSIAEVEKKVASNATATATHHATIEGALDNRRKQILDGIASIIDGSGTGPEPSKTINLNKLMLEVKTKNAAILHEINKISGRSGPGTPPTRSTSLSDLKLAVQHNSVKILNRIGELERANPASWYDLVTRFIVIDRSKTRAMAGQQKTQSIFSVSGFNRGVESPPERLETWLAGFGQAMKACEHHPSIRISGFASAEDFRRTLASPQNLCRNLDDKRTKSDINNCRLANLRAARAAVIISTAFEREKAPTKDEVLKSMNKSCGNNTGHAAVSKYVNIEPWCNVGDMLDARFRFEPVELAVHSLNRSVRIRIEEPSDCPGF